MKLNHECVRDLLIYLEDELLFTSNLCANDIKIDPHESADIVYAVAKLSESKYIEASQISYSFETMPIFHIQSITWNGHKLLDNIRDENVWKKTKSIVAQFSSVSIGIIDNVSNRIIAKIINEYI